MCPQPSFPRLVPPVCVCSQLMRAAPAAAAAVAASAASSPAMRRGLSSLAPLVLPSDRWASTHLSPAVQFMLRSGNFAPASVAGTGRAGRILKGDVLKAIRDGTIRQDTAASKHATTAAASSSAPAATGSSGPSSLGRRVREFTDVPLTNIRKVIASRLSASKQSIPHAYASTTLKMDGVLALRAAWKAEGRESLPSVNDFIIRASALALRRVPQANTTYNPKSGEFTQSPTVDISVAVATETGLITPIVKRADEKRMDAVSAEVKELANKAKNNKLKPEEFQGGSFTSDATHKRCVRSRCMRDRFERAGVFRRCLQRNFSSHSPCLAVCASHCAASRIWACLVSRTSPPSSTRLRYASSPWVAACSESMNRPWRHNKRRLRQTRPTQRPQRRRVLQRQQQHRLHCHSLDLARSLLPRLPLPPLLPLCFVFPRRPI